MTLVPESCNVDPVILGLGLGRAHNVAVFLPDLICRIGLLLG